MIEYFDGVKLGARVKFGMALGTIVGFGIKQIGGIRERTIYYKWDGDEGPELTLFPDYLKNDEDEAEAVA